MVTLNTFYRSLNRRLSFFEEWFLGHSDEIEKNTQVHWLALEGLLSQTWQSWGRFCRQTVMASGLGCVTRNGNHLAPTVTPAQWERISYVAMCVKNQSTVKAGKTNKILRYEITWGDVNRLINIINFVNPQNKGQLLTGFGAIGRGPRHLQIVRNSAAHLNHETFSDVRALIPVYDTVRSRHPTDALFWIDPTTQNFAYLSWVQDMRDAANIVTQ